MTRLAERALGGAYSALIALGAFWDGGELTASEICYGIAAGLGGAGIVAYTNRNAPEK